VHGCGARYEDYPKTLMISWPGTFHRELVQGTIREFILRSLEGWHVSKELVKGTCPRIR